MSVGFKILFDYSILNFDDWTNWQGQGCGSRPLVHSTDWNTVLGFHIWLINLQILSASDLLVWLEHFQRQGCGSRPFVRSKRVQSTDYNMVLLTGRFCRGRDVASVFMIVQQRSATLTVKQFLVFSSRMHQSIDPRFCRF